MTFDCNAYLGHWFARQIRNNTAPELVALMDENEIDKACVGSLSAIMYRNGQPGNEKLAEEIADYRDRLVPFGVINPDYPDWEYDLDWCHNEMGAKGIRIYPQYHNYAMADSCCDELCEACKERGLVVTLIQRQVDYRQSHWMVDAPDLNLDEIAELCAKHPETSFMLLNGIGITGSKLVTEAEELPANAYFGISRTQPFYGRDINKLIESVGVERVLFGTGIPMKYPETAFLNLKHADTSEENKEKIRGGNLAKLLGV